MNKQLIECVPNFSEGRDLSIIKQITDVIEAVDGVKLLDVDPGKATNRTVVTFVGEPEPVIEAAYQAMKKASEVIDMSKQEGEHPRMGATDVCPLIPIANITMEETAEYAHKLGERAGQNLEIPFYMYESAATKKAWRNLATIRAGEYEALPEKLGKAEWKPDYGPSKFNAKSGATAIGARGFLIAYNVNLNTTSVRRANSVAFDVREQGRAKRKGNPITGAIVKDKKGNPQRVPGACKSVKGIGWFIEEYGIAQISMNLTDINISPLHKVFEECCKSANKRGMRVTGSELVGLVPLQVMLDAGRYFLKKQERSIGVSDAEIIKIAAKSLGLDELSEFDPQKKIIEYQLEGADTAPLLAMNLRSFADETASESMAPGGGSIAAYVGALGVSLATMVANLSSHKRGWDSRWEEFSTHAAEGQRLKDALLKMVDEDTNSFNAIIAAFRLPKGNESEKVTRKAAVQAATKYAIEVPYKVMELSLQIFDLSLAMIKDGNPNSITDAGVGALCARTAVHGAFMNVKINTADLEDKKYVAKVLRDGKKLASKADKLEKEVAKLVAAKIG
ncbi:MAG: glutamate formiminotransferase/formiminotetrahydrofolate cyclodeaminase [Polaribacter sp.]|jgi:glutamate formiminotransferase/formiminotetrahydrofolate cyclodeaminase